jgi:hypothetical protein
MPFEFKEHDKGLFIRYFGFVTPSDYFDSRKEIASLPHQPTFEFVVCDFTDMDADSIWAMTRDISDAVGKRDAEVPRNQDALRKLALVSPSQKILDLLEYYVKHYQRAPNAEARTFRLPSQAWSWVREDRRPE